MLPTCKFSKTGGQIVTADKKILEQAFPLHWHDCFEIEFIVSGCGIHCVNGKEYPIHPGDCYVLSPLDYHEIRPIEPLHLFHVMFEEHQVSVHLIRHMLAVFVTQVSPIVSYTAEEQTEFSVLFQCMMNRNDSADPADPTKDFSDAYITALLDCILILYLRKYDVRVTDSNHSVVREAVHYVNLHFTEHLSLSEIAERLHFNVSYFSRLFKKTTGQGFSRYLTELRMRYAGRLLTTTKMSVTDTCYAAGFGTYSHFMRSFKAYFGMSPQLFRQKNMV